MDLSAPVRNKTRIIISQSQRIDALASLLEKECQLATSEQIEVYRQRYETYRHLDKLRWQMVQIAVAVAPLVLAFSMRTGKNPPWWAWAVVGLFLLNCAWVMERIRKGIQMNAVVLSKVGQDVGDIDQPLPKGASKSSAFWVAIGLYTFGAASLLTSLISLGTS